MSDFTSRVGRLDDVAMPDDYDLDADEVTQVVKCPPGYAFSQSASPALYTSRVKRHMVLDRGLGWVKGFLTGRAQAQTRQDCDCKVLMDLTGATLSMRLPHDRYTAVGQAAAEGSWVLLKEVTMLPRMFHSELLAPS